jgi:predicted RNase H-like HicB family nuclease
MLFHALVEEWPGESMVFFRELPGCFATASTTEAAIQAAPAAIAQYFRWLKANELSLVEGEVEPITVVLSERLNSQDEHTGPLFEADRLEPTEEEIENALNVAATARALIIEIIAAVPEQSLRQATTPTGWSLQQHLQHILETESWYISRLQTQPDLLASSDTLTADEMAMKVFENAMDNELLLHSLTPAQYTEVFHHDNEAWTAAKVLRRQAEHLYEHLLCMLEIEKQLGVRS